MRRHLLDTNITGKTSRDEADRVRIFEENIFCFTEKAVRRAIENIILATVAMHRHSVVQNVLRVNAIEINS